MTHRSILQDGFVGSESRWGEFLRVPFACGRRERKRGPGDQTRDVLCAGDQWQYFGQPDMP